MEDTARLVLFTIVWTTVWIAPLPRLGRRTELVAVVAYWSLWATGLPVERVLATRLPAPLPALAPGSAIGAVIRWTPSPIPFEGRRSAAVVAMLAVPLAVVAGLVTLRLVGRLPPEHVSQGESIVTLASGTGAALAGLMLGGFHRPRSRWLFAMTVGVAAGAVVALYA